MLFFCEFFGENSTIPNINFLKMLNNSMVTANFTHCKT